MDNYSGGEGFGIPARGKYVDFMTAGLKLGNQAVGVALRPAARGEEVAFNDAYAHGSTSAGLSLRTLYGKEAGIAIAQRRRPGG